MSHFSSEKKNSFHVSADPLFESFFVIYSQLFGFKICSPDSWLASATFFVALNSLCHPATVICWLDCMSHQGLFFFPSQFLPGELVCSLILVALYVSSLPIIFFSSAHTVWSLI